MYKFLLSTFIALPLMALTIDMTPPEVTLEGDTGAKIDGSPWHSSMLQGKVHVLFYVDPDEKDTNNAFSEALKAEELDRSQFASVAIINMAATWLPNFAIASKLKEKQEKYPDTLYVKDLDKVLVKAWEIADDSSNVLIFNKSGQLIYIKEGQISDAEIPQVVALVKAAL